MARRFNETSKWKNERWFRLLPPLYKLAWEYISAQCDISGVWQINCLDMKDDLGFEQVIDLDDFIRSCNRDWDKVSGLSIECERLIQFDERFLWMTPFMVEQYLGKKDRVNPDDPLTRSAMKKLSNHSKLAHAIRRGWIPLTDPYEGVLRGLPTPLEGVKEREREKEREINTDIVSAFFPEEGRKHKKVSPAAPDDGEPSIPALRPVRGGSSDDLPAPEEQPMMTAKEFLEYERKMVDDKLFIEPIMMSKGIKDEGTLRRWIVEFHIQITGDEKLRKSYKEYKLHFKNWLNLMWPKGLPEAQQQSKTTKGQVIPQHTPESLKEKYGKP